MSIYVAKVKDNSGKIFKEKIEAASEEQARLALKNRYPAVGKVSKSGFEIDLTQLELALAKVTVKDKAGIFSPVFGHGQRRGGDYSCLGYFSRSSTQRKTKKSSLGY